MQVNWSHFTLADFLELRWRLLNDWQAVLPGGEYFGQVRIGDVCYDIQIEWLAEDEPDTGDTSDDKAAGSPEQDDDTEEADIDDLEDWNELGDSVDGMELMVTMSPFFPHDEDEAEPPYDELVPGMPYDTQHGCESHRQPQAFPAADLRELRRACRAQHTGDYRPLPAPPSRGHAADRLLGPP